MKDDGRDIKLVTIFLNRLNKKFGYDYAIKERPEVTDRNQKAVEAIAMDSKGNTIAIEHTLIEPFVGDKEDIQPFLAIFGSLETDKSFALRQYDIEVIVPIGAVGKGVSWDEVRIRVTEWFTKNIKAFPIGSSQQHVTGLPFSLGLGIWKDFRDDSPGTVTLARSGLPSDFNDVIARALSKKLQKLVNTCADRRVLLLEKDSLPRGYFDFYDAIKSAEPEIPDLSKIDEIWVPNTVVWEREGYLPFYRVWPGPDPHKHTESI
jgi:hypothetical protein